MLQMSKSFNFSHGFLLVLSSHKVLLNLKTCLAAPTTVSFDNMKVKLIKNEKIISVLYGWLLKRLSKIIVRLYNSLKSYSSNR